MKELKYKVVNNSKLMKYFFRKSIFGFVLGKTIYARKNFEDWTPVMKNHEFIHLAQYDKHGTLKFLFIYFIKELFKGYRKKSFEVEAYDNENDFDYIKNTYNIILTKK